MRAARLLLVHDDSSVAAAMRASIRRSGQRAAIATTPHAAIAICLRHRPIDVAVINSYVAGMDGAELGARLRTAEARVVIVLADSDDLAGRAAALRRGADDYIAKPVSINELLARAAGALQRARDPDAPIEAGSVRIDPKRRTVIIADAPVTLTRKQFALLAELARAGGAVVSRRRLLATVWETDWQGTSQTLTVHISTLRSKLGGHAHIQAVRGVGYRLIGASNER